MQHKSSWLIPSKAEWKAMLWSGLYVLVGYMLLRFFFWFFLSGPLGDYNPWPKPLILLSWALTDFNSLIMSWGIPSLLASALCGMLGGLFIYRGLRRKAGQRPLTSADGWRAGAVVGAWIGISLAVLFFIAPFGIFPTSKRIADAVTSLPTWGIRQYLQVLRVVSILTLFITAVGAVLGRLLYARGIAAGAEPEADLNDRGAERTAFRPGCVGLLVLAFFTTYFYSDVSRLLSKIPLPPPAFMTTGDFGIVSQEPCGPPCFQGITPGVTTIEDAYLNLLKAGAPCRMSESRFEAGARVDSEDVECYSGKGYISIQSRHLSGQQDTDEAKVIVDSIMLKPPTKVTVGQLIARYGPPDAVREATFQDRPGNQSFMSFYFDEQQTYVEFPIQRAAAYTVAPDTAIESVSYRTAADYQKVIDDRTDTLLWKGYGMYAAGNAFLSASAPTMTPSDFGILSHDPCGAPCFQGIRLGITTFEDATQIVVKMGLLCGVSDGSSGGRKALSCHDGDTKIEIGANGEAGAKSPVDAMTLYPPVKVTVGEFISQYGPPGSVWPGYAGNDAGVMLFYDSLHTVVMVAMPPAQACSIAPDTKIAGVMYLTAAMYEEGLSMQIAGGMHNQPWKGYGMYVPSVPFTPTPASLPTPTP